MHNTLIGTWTSFGKQAPKQTGFLHSIKLRQHYKHDRPLISCRYNLNNNHIYLLDSIGAIIDLNLSTNHYTLSKHNATAFTIEGQNSLLILNNCNELQRIECSKKKKIINVNMTNICSLQKNQQRQLVLMLSKHLLYLYDIKHPNRSKSLKAQENNLYNVGCFSSNNRFIIVAIRNIQIKIIQIMNISTIHQIQIPFPIPNIHIEVAYHNGNIAIYGECNVIFFVVLDAQLQLTYELIEIPFLKSIKQLKYTYLGDIILLANDQVIYGIADDNRNKIVPIFNQDNRMNITAFDLSLDTKNLLLVSNRTIKVLDWQEGLRKVIKGTKEHHQIRFAENSDSKRLHEQINPQVHFPQQGKQSQHQFKQKKYQYEQQQQEESNHYELQAYPKLITPRRAIHIPALNYHQNISTDIDASVTDNLLKLQLQAIFDKFPLPPELNRQSLIQLLLNLQKKLSNHKNSTDKLATIYHMLLEAIIQQLPFIQKFSLIFCPQVMVKIQKKYRMNYTEFFLKHLCMLFKDYLSHSNWIRVINWIIQGTDIMKPQKITLFFIVFLKNHYQSLKEEDQSKLQIQQLHEQIDIESIFNEIDALYQSPKYQYVFAQHVEESKYAKISLKETIKGSQQETLEELLLKQEKLKRAINDLPKYMY